MAQPYSSMPARSAVKASYRSGSAHPIAQAGRPLAQGQEPDSAGGKARDRRGLGPQAMELRAAIIRGPKNSEAAMPIRHCTSMNRLTVFISVALLTFGFCAAQAQNAQDNPQSMRFFVTSVGSGKGGDLGGLAGADAHCQSLAAAVGAGARTWHAYLSTQTAGGVAAVNARDRIGAGPWYNAKATLIARDLSDCTA